MSASQPPSHQKNHKDIQIMNQGVKISRFGVFPKVSVPVFAVSAFFGHSIYAVWCDI